MTTEEWNETIKAIRASNAYICNHNYNLEIPVVQESNEQDWEYTFVDDGSKKVMAVF